MSSQTSLATSPSVRPTVFLLSLDKPDYWDELWSNLVDGLADKATIKRATTAEKALKYLLTNTPSVIIATDPTMVQRKQSIITVCDKIIQYVRSGGTFVLATQFSSLVRPTDLTLWFRDTWNLPWEFGDYHRTTVHLNPERYLPGPRGFPKSNNQKAVFLKNVTKRDAVYLPSATSRRESAVFPPTPVDTHQTPVARTKVGEGWLGYVGDVNSDSDAIILALCGL